jgi:hypothetical protein
VFPWSGFASRWSCGSRAALLAFVAYALTASLAGADAASGTYTGTVAARGNYYWERSTRVVAPSISASLSTPVGVRVDAAYLIDAITSASVATGVQDDLAFTEKRHDVQAGLGYELDLGAAQLDLSARVRMSREPDYHSQGAGFGAALSLDQRNTVFAFNGYFVHDDVYRVLRFMPTNDPDQLFASEAQRVGDLNVLSLGFAWDQVLSRTVTMTLGYDLALLNGFQANAYRSVAFANGGIMAEHHPDQRTRHAPYVWMAKYFETPRLALRVGYRFYRDNWDINAHAVDVRAHQEIGEHFELRLRYRYFHQDRAFFHDPDGNLSTDRYWTADPKMGHFHNQTFGLKMRLSLDFLGFTRLDVLRTAALDWGVEYVLNNNRYGNGVIAQGGLAWSF